MVLPCFFFFFSSSKQHSLCKSCVCANGIKCSVNVMDDVEKDTVAMNESCEMAGKCFERGKMQQK